ncbi:hypothetical protein ADL15_47580 [Actinoplanes awajinensis subsp. mycoplanecinus]|uniref:HTH marR-type domain-containing protein n=1 Tax=Actinoplanes awajinensis subsp. mycoplanecinus TaxID=135947 RepID=A0A117MKQ2_9ACTN|nr:hypothetical protein ADL15_47580 [Actinoplanes awajinensis subsp. mycoplanecinus]
MPVLRALAESDTTVGELAGRLAVPVQEIVRRVGALEARGYVRRLGAAGDVRDRRIQITTAGDAAAAADRHDELAVEEQLVARLGAVEVTAARNVLLALLEVADRPAART